MTREEFGQLTIPDQLWFILQTVRGAKGTSAPTGGGEPPKWDTAISRKGGMVQYASECSAKELSYWLENAKKPPREEKYRAQNEKQAKALSFWLSWRQANPDAVWRGERNRVAVVAAPPSDKPQQYPRGVTAGPVKTASAPTPNFDEDAPDEFGDIPF